MPISIKLQSKCLAKLLTSLVQGKMKLDLVGRFILSSYKYTKKAFTIVKELKKTIRKSMVTGIGQKSCTALFPLWLVP